MAPPSQQPSPKGPDLSHRRLGLPALARHVNKITWDAHVTSFANTVSEIHPHNLLLRFAATVSSMPCRIPQYGCTVIHLSSPLAIYRLHFSRRQPFEIQLVA